MPLETLTQAELVERIRERDPAAEGELCRRFAPRVRLYGLRHLRDEDRAADLVQSVLLAVLEAARAGRIEDPARVDRFVLGTCRNLTLGVHARDRRTKLTDDGEVDLGDFTPSYERVDSAVLYRCLMLLEERAQKVILRTFQTDETSDEIASALSLSVANVRVVRHRALSQLRECVDGKHVHATGGTA